MNRAEPKNAQGAGWLNICQETPASTKLDAVEQTLHLTINPEKRLLQHYATPPSE